MAIWSAGKKFLLLCTNIARGSEKNNEHSFVSKTPKVSDNLLLIILLSMNLSLTMSLVADEMSNILQFCNENLYCVTSVPNHAKRQQRSAIHVFSCLNHIWLKFIKNLQVINYFTSCVNGMCSYKSKKNIKHFGFKFLKLTKNYYHIDAVTDIFFWTN